MKAADRFGRAAFGMAALVYLAVCVSVLRHSVPWLLGYVADDAFYYLQIARHLAAGGRSTFDGLNPTNGYHPGWMLLMTALARIYPDKVILLKASLGLEFGFQFATSLVLAAIVRRFAGSFWGWIASTLWLLSPLPLTLALYGVEAPFAQFTVAVAVWMYLTQIAPFLRPGTAAFPSRSLVLFGLSLALAFYGRTDQMLLAVTALALLLRLTWLRTVQERRIPACARVLLWTGGAFAAAALPWYWFSYASCGTFTQDSGAMKILWHARSIPGWNVHTLAIGPLKFAALFWIAAPFWALFTGAFPPNSFAAVLALLVLCFLIAAAGAMSRRAAPRSEPSLEEADALGSSALGQVTGWLGAALLLSGLVYGLLVDDPQFWHLAVPSLTLFLLLAAWGAKLARQRLGLTAQRRVGMVVVCAALGVCVWHRLQVTPPYPWQRDVYASEPRFEALIPASARIGCFDAGIPAYFSPRTVINLDGLVNHTAVAYWKTNTLNGYVSAQDIAYIANEPATVAHAQEFTSAPIPLTLVAFSALHGWNTGQRDLWRVEPPKKEFQNFR